MIAFLAITLSGCAEVGFSETADHASSEDTSKTGVNDPQNPPPPPPRDEDPTNVPPGQCYPELQALTRNIKVLFVVDASGSNVQNEATDPDKNFRKGSMQRFFNLFRNKSNFHWGLVTFQEAYYPRVTKSYIGNSNNQASFTSNANTMASALGAFNMSTDDGRTPYKSALSFAENIIKNDADISVSSPTAYVVVFVSDGLLTDYSDGTDQAALLADVQKIQQLKPGLVSFNTVFYGLNDSAGLVAKQRLQNMAAMGNGAYFDASQDNYVKFEETVKVPGVACVL